MSDPEPGPEPAAPKKRRTFLGPANAAGLGGWAGLACALLAAAGWVAVQNGAWRSAGERLLYGLLCLGTWAFLLVAPGAAVGWVGGAVVRWVQRRRATTWPVWRAEFAGGFAAGTLLAMGVGWLIAVSMS